MGNVCGARDDPGAGGIDEYYDWLEKVRNILSDDEQLQYECANLYMGARLGPEGTLETRREVYVIVRQLLQEYHCDGQELLGAEQVFHSYATTYPRLDPEQFNHLVRRIYQQIERNLHRKVVAFEASAFVPQEPGAPLQPQYAQHPPQDGYDASPAPAYARPAPAYASPGGYAPGASPWANGRAVDPVSPPPPVVVSRVGDLPFGQTPYSPVAEPPVQDSDDEELYRVQQASFNSVASVRSVPSTVANRATGTYESVVVTGQSDIIVPTSGPLSAPPRPPPPLAPQASDVDAMKALLLGTGLRAGVYNQSRVVEPKRLRVNGPKTDLSIIDDSPGALEDVKFPISDCNFLEMGYRNEMVGAIVPRPPEDRVAAFRFRSGSLCVQFYFADDAGLCAKALKQLCNLPTLSDPA